MSCQESESYSEELELERGKKGTASVITRVLNFSGNQINYGNNSFDILYRNLELEN